VPLILWTRPGSADKDGVYGRKSALDNRGGILRARIEAFRKTHHAAGAAMVPQFRSGQTVRIFRGLLNKSGAEGEYKIVRQLPDNGSELQYRVKSDREPYERVVKESDLERV
jgi:hypothetical protein